MATVTVHTPEPVEPVVTLTITPLELRQLRAAIGNTGGAYGLYKELDDAVSEAGWSKNDVDGLKVMSPGKMEPYSW